jgi:hypothetical protein
LCPAQLPGAPHTLATDGLIDINLDLVRSPTERAVSQVCSEANTIYRHMQNP